MTAPRADRGSTLPMILGFVVLALLTTAGSIAAGQAFVAQRGLQDVCDGAAAAAAAGSADLSRDSRLADGSGLRFTDVQAATTAYLGRDPDRAGVRIDSRLSPDARTITLTCTETRPVVFGAVFGHPGGVRHTVTAAVHAPLR